MPAVTALAAAAPGLAEDASTTPGPAQDLQPIVLMKPQTDGGKSVLAALQERKTDHNIKPDALPPQMLSNLT